MCNYWNTEILNCFLGLNYYIKWLIDYGSFYLLNLIIWNYFHYNFILNINFLCVVVEVYYIVITNETTEISDLNFFLEQKNLIVLRKKSIQNIYKIEHKK